MGTWPPSDDGALLDSHFHTSQSDYVTIVTGGVWTWLDVTAGIVKSFSSGAQNDALTWRLPRALEAGTYSLVWYTVVDTNLGIATVETSPDGVTWTALTTVDLYDAGGTAIATLETTGLTIPSGVLYVRHRMATKNAGSSNYYSVICSVDLVRTA